MYYEVKTRDFTKEELKRILNWLLERKIINYGYDYRDFKRLSNYASKFRRLIKENYNNILHNEKVKEGYFMGGRLGISAYGVEYTVGQSFNEEYINIMADILNRSGVYKSRLKWYS